MSYNIFFHLVLFAFYLFYSNFRHHPALCFFSIFFNVFNFIDFLFRYALNSRLKLRILKAT